MPHNWDVVYTIPIFVWSGQQIHLQELLFSFPTSIISIQSADCRRVDGWAALHRDIALTSNTFSLVNGMAAGSPQPAATTSRCMYGA